MSVAGGLLVDGAAGGVAAGAGAGRGLEGCVELLGGWAGGLAGWRAGGEAPGRQHVAFDIATEIGNWCSSMHTACSAFSPFNMNLEADRGVLGILLLASGLKRNTNFQFENCSIIEFPAGCIQPPQKKGALRTTPR